MKRNIQFKLEFEMYPEIERDEFESDFDLVVSNPKLCDGVFLN